MDSPEEADVVIQPATLVQVERRVGCLPERWLAVVTLKVECLPSGDVTTEAFPLVTSAGMVKERLSRMVELPVDVLQLNHAGHCVDDQMTLEQLGARVNDTLSLSLTSTHPHMFPIRIKHTTLPPLPDVITVRLRHSKFPSVPIRHYLIVPHLETWIFKRISRLGEKCTSQRRISASVNRISNHNRP